MLSLETYLRDCIEAGRRAGDDPNSRSRQLVNHPSFTLLDRAWKPVAMAIVQKEEPRNPDQEVQVKATRRRGVRRRGARGASGIEAFLEPVDTIRISQESPAYRLAVLLIHKGRDPKSWKSEDDALIDELRSTCNSGVHPVWAQAARECPLIAMLGAFPSTTPSTKETKESLDWIGGLRRDPSDFEGFGKWLENVEHPELDSKSVLDLQRLAKGLQGRIRSTQIRKDAPKILSTTSDPSLIIIDALLHIASNQPHLAVERIEGADIKGKKIQSISNDLHHLARLQSGDFDAWKSCACATGNDALSSAMLTAAWTNPIEQDLDFSTIESGIFHLEKNNLTIPDSLQWMFIRALAAKGDIEEATKLIMNAKIEDSASFMAASRMAKGHEALVERLCELAINYDTNIWEGIIADDDIPTQIRVCCATHLSRFQLSSSTLEQVIEILVNGNDIESLAQVICKNALPGSENPYPILLVSSLAPANLPPENISWIQEQAVFAHDIVESIEPPSYLSINEAALIRLLDGASANLEEIQGRLPESGSEVLREARRALMDGGDGLVREQRVDALELAIIESNLPELERALFLAIVDLLRMNRVNNDVQMTDSDRKERAYNILDTLISNRFNARFFPLVTDLIIEHEVPSSELVFWLQNHHPRSEWTPVANAAISVREGRHLDAARLYKQAAPRFQNPPHGDFERATLLYRKALINFALSKRWSEAADLLDEHTELAATITSRFQLYLKVSYAFDKMPKSGSRSKRSLNHPKHMILDFADSRLPSAEVNTPDDDGSKRRERERRKEDIIESLMSYPSSRQLPEEPFIGRVRAALNHIQRVTSSRRYHIETRFRNALNDFARPKEVYEIAKEVAPEDPLRALRMMEHAINVSSHYNLREQASLQASMDAMYQQYESQIAVKERRGFNSLNLPPLIVIDTNLLLDGLASEILRRMTVDRNGLMNPNSSLMFHQILRHRANTKLVRTFVPSTALNEFRSRIMNTDTGEYDPQRALSLIYNVRRHINIDAYYTIITPKVLEEIHLGILEEFRDWPAPTEEGFHEGVLAQTKAVENFLQAHHSIYEQVTNFKARRGGADKRTTLSENGMLVSEDGIFPEPGDLDIMKTASKLASDNLERVGAVVIATRDSDFTLLARALEETLGVGVAKNAIELAQWL
ncbi:MAG TPA: hypothetical protein D7H85_00010 [Candidatus Poseidoniales archaeon]|nr:MAG TPA: hypothetical protein D7H85_00010 [Candidatus Poseidoniales archaeon]